MGFQSLNDTMDTQEDYESASKSYVGTVISNADPMGIGRVKADIPGLYDSKQGDVPWIGPEKQSPFGTGPGFGVYGSPAAGSKITVVLQDGDEHHPMFQGGVLATSDVPPEFKDPNVWGFKDPKGNTLRVDLAGGTWSFTTASGYQMNIDASGNLSVDVPGNTTMKSGGNVSVEAGGSVAIQAGGTATYTASSHNFVGPITGNSTLVTAGTITDESGSGNTKTIGDFRRVFDSHEHHYWDDGSENTTSVPIQQI